MNLTRTVTVDGAMRRRFEDLYARYRQLYEDPDGCRPMIIVDPPVDGLPSWEARLADPLVMLQAELDSLRPHLDLGDDRVPTVRVQFGTPQVAAAFGCPLHVPDNSLPAAGRPVLARAEDAFDLPLPPPDAGWYGKLAEWTALWRRLLPPGIEIQHPDIQSAFNSAHLIRGNEIFTDFYDCPAAVDALLDKVTDFMIVQTRRLKAMISDDPDWFFDWGALWKGAARISNCTMQLISPRAYREHVLPRDIRFLQAVGGGRLHYCGLAREVVDEFLKLPGLSGLDVDFSRHDFFELCARAPRRVVVFGRFSEDHPTARRLLAGEWPGKRNLVICLRTASAAGAAAQLRRLRAAIPHA